MGKLIAVALPKGGVGKTTTAVSLAFSLASKNNRILLIDVDPTGSCTISMGFNNRTIHGDIFDVFSYSKSLKDVIHSTDHGLVDFIPQRKLSSVDENRQLKLSSNDILLRNLIRPMACEYDYILFDCPPYLFGMTNNSLIAADSVLIPVKADQFSLKAIDDLLQRIRLIKKNFNQKLFVEGIFITAYEKNTRASFMAKRELYDHYSRYMLHKSIPKDSGMMNASFYHKPLCLLKPNARSSIAYLDLAEEISNHGKIF